MATNPRPFDRLMAGREALRRLEQPPAKPWIERPRETGDLVTRFTIPLELCPTSNETRRKPDWYYAKQRTALFTVMVPGFLDSRRPRGKALPGRPQVLATRFCPRPPDACSDWAKSAIDRLILPLHVKRNGRWVDCQRFGLITDDSPPAADVRQWWEPCPAALGCVLIQLRTGEL